MLKFLVIGLGAVGGTVANLLKQNGFTVHAVDRNPAKDLAFTTTGVCGEHTSHLDARYTDVDLVTDIGFDYILVCTKSTLNHSVAKKISRFSRTHPKIVLMQNGILVEEPFLERFPKQRIIRCVINFGAQKTGVQSTQIKGIAGVSSLGNLNHLDCPGIRRLEKSLTGTPLEFQATQNISTKVNDKFIINNVLNASGAVLNATIGDMMKCNYGKQIILKTAEETLKVLDSLKSP